MVKIYKIWCIVFCFTFIYSCKEDPKKYGFQPDTAAYFKFKNNSNWIYKNIANPTMLDTVFGNGAGEGFASRDAGLTEISSITLNGKSSPQVIIRAEAIATSNIDRIAILTKINNILYPSPVIININGTMNSEDSTNLVKLISFDLSGSQYEDVWEMTLKNHPYFSKLYFAKNLGIIRKTLRTGETYDLINYTPGN